MPILAAALLVPPPAAAGGTPPASGPGAVRVIRGLVYRIVDGRHLALDVYRPAGRRGTRPAPILLLVPGGGFTAGSRDEMGPLALLAASQGWVAIALDYRLAPAATFPAPVEDVRAALGWVRARSRRWDADPARVAALGSSAGGTLVAHLAATQLVPAGRTGDLGAAATWSAPLNLGPDRARTGPPVALGEAPVDAYLGCPALACAGRARMASPYLRWGKGSPPVMLVTASVDLVPRRQAVAAARRLARIGVPHRLMVLPVASHATAYADRAWAPTERFLRRALSGR